VNVDEVLRMLEEGAEHDKIQNAAGISAEQLSSVTGRIERNKHKRKSPPVPELY